MSLYFASVFDDRGPLTTVSALNLLLLTLSWSECAGIFNKHPLKVHVIRPGSTRIIRWMESLGAEIAEEDKPHFLNGFSATYNKLLGVLGKKKNDTAVLIDNDVVFNKNTADIASRASEHVMANLADYERAPADIINEVKDRLDLGLIEEKWHPVKYEYEDLNNNRAPRSLDNYYFNSGVVTFPPGSKLQWIWQRHSGIISKYFSGRYPGQLQRDGFGSDQLSLSTAIKEHGRFKPLDCRYNYRMHHFRLGCRTDLEIAIIHNAMIKRSHKMLADTSPFSPESVIRHFFDSLVAGPVINDLLPQKKKRLEIIETVRDQMLGYIENSGINDLREFGDLSV